MRAQSFKLPGGTQSSDAAQESPPFPSSRWHFPALPNASLLRPVPTVQAIRPHGAAGGCGTPPAAVHAVAPACSRAGGGCAHRHYQLSHALGRARWRGVGGRSRRRLGQRGQRGRRPPRPALRPSQLAGRRARRQQAQPAGGPPRPDSTEPGGAAGRPAPGAWRRPRGHRRGGTPV